tara:strand:+ start:415 stop:1113 length:699 start_codon:yes stop_codon:yes gene_type:complete
MKPKTDTEELFKLITEKSSLKTEVYNNTLDSFNLIKDVITNLTNQFSKYKDNNKSAMPTTFVAKPNGKFEIDLKFGGDLLLIMMHTNVFEFPRTHEVMRTPYVKADTNRSYCGIINIYNFLADSFKYNRVNDIGYLIGRIFVNKEKHYFIEGKRELGLLYNDFGKNILNEDSVETIIKAAVKYTINFDLLTPHYDLAKFVQVKEMKSTIDSISIKTGKRLGYKFLADEDGGK